MTAQCIRTNVQRAGSGARTMTGRLPRPLWLHMPLACGSAPSCAAGRRPGSTWATPRPASTTPRSRPSPAWVRSAVATRPRHNPTPGRRARLVLPGSQPRSPPQHSRHGAPRDLRAHQPRPRPVSPPANITDVPGHSPARPHRGPLRVQERLPPFPGLTPPGAGSVRPREPEG